MKTPKDQLKFPLGLYKAANEAKLLRAVEFYYDLKVINREGCFLDSDFIKIATTNIGCSINTAKKYRSLLLKLDFAELHHKFIRLKSYGHVWGTFGITPNEHGKIKLFLSKKGKLFEDVLTQEIELNLKHQKYKLEKKYLEHLGGKNTIKTDPKYVKEKKLLPLSDSEKCRKQREQTIQKRLSTSFHFNAQVTLTCEKIAQLFGLKNKSEGHLISRWLKHKGRIKVEKQKDIIVRKGFVKSSLPHLNLDDSFFVFKNLLIKKMPNLITVIK